MVTLKEIHKFAVEEGIKEDPRDREKIEEMLEKRGEKYEDLEGVKKEKFDEDRLENPFDDSKVIYGGDEDVKRVAVGIDIETQDLVLIDRLNEKGEDIDGALAHHPEGRALANLHEVMGLQIDTLERAGVPVSQAEGIVRPRAEEVKKNVHAANHPRAPKTAELLDIPMLNLHTVCDNHAYQFMEDYLEEEEFETLGDLIDVILELPEYGWALEYEMGPEIFAGSENNRAGKVEVLGFTGGTSLKDNLIEKMVESGIDTIVVMHARKEQIEKAKEENINIISAGHMPSDSLGINLLLDKIQNEFDLEFFELSGFKRVER
ncbi:MAG: NGG1p interacting factor NIF3 [Candidatus Aenigmatarchaeota archaeon]